ncbi:MULTISPECIES: hypothetical protein [unclassified Sulfitobacter]|uniref:hypothetical protein n=1 Tax=unclassified Sulfitobacter TaxID=196795 RepID=UPI0023E2DEA7|nr:MULTISPECIES: hypothetical protein [unclassified Sulfitobacter]MDF3413594.1 hypothetical protein [Sulfitobacter sp. KE5]MDF3421124.1 hypothetical protein [Sulfitobacter sp. KE43]MDF3473223.1 hypothetical protein [Sulfitobacter sp. M48]MDF3488824.1 hypothetical protein [Sulfitobacter sp. M60]MDF3500539.1 hypothetical protein [Sulfitobacter sp. Ks17]MDF3520028.1 hypothetical protein [Sulfitobacter sp. M74]MDF3527836.1 hypothetical protein [Sulfitobacter sp. M77]MDF3535648.1 hypothetical pr
MKIPARFLLKKTSFVSSDWFLIAEDHNLTRVFNSLKPATAQFCGKDISAAEPFYVAGLAPDDRTSGCGFEASRL